MKTSQRQLTNLLCGALVLGSGGALTWGQALDKQTPPPTRRPSTPDLSIIQPPLSTNVNRLTNRPSPPLLAPSKPTIVPTQRSLTPNLPPPGATAAPSLTARSAPSLLAWDQEFKEVTVKPGDTNALITFHFTNVHSSELVIKAVRASCGCTTLELPAMPWHIPAGSNGQITANTDLRGRRGVQTKSLMVESSLGYKSLLFKVIIPPDLVTNTVVGQIMDAERVHNMQVALVDRQALFKNQDCIKCHLEPVKGQVGQELFAAACGICHGSPKRATIVPDLKTISVPTSAPYWKYWIVNGRPGSLMPAFAESRGGPLTEDQVNSLVQLLTDTISRQARPTPGSNSAVPRPVSTPTAPPKAVVPAGTPSASP
jgi:mono/diheme cytochrome c family protein